MLLEGDALLERILSVPAADRDALVDELLGIGGVPDDVDLPRSAVPYLPCGVEEILTMVREAPLGPDDRLVDLGSGLGRVAILAHLLSGASCLGIEIQEPLVRSARTRCEALQLTDVVEFVHANAVDAELDGSVFFLYAPFNGDTLVRVVRRLDDLAKERSIVVAAVDLELQDIASLAPRKTSSVALTLYDSAARSSGV